jgi:hypothetical protein
MFSINVRSDICGDNLFGPHVLPNRFTGRIYKAFVENKADFLAEVPMIVHLELHFVQDGAPAYFSLVARRYRNRSFLVGGQVQVDQLPGLHAQLIYVHWISTCGTI